VQPADDGVEHAHGGAGKGEAERFVEGDDESQVLRGEAPVQRGRLAGIRVAGDFGDVRAQGGVHPSRVELEARHVHRLGLPGDRNTFSGMRDRRTAIWTTMAPSDTSSSNRKEMSSCPL
jgi:hypothetical protein